MPHVHVMSHVEHGRTPHWNSAVGAGIIAGIVFLVLEMLLVPLFVPGTTPWTPVRMVGAIALGQDALPPPHTFSLTVFLAAALVHFALSIIYALIGAYLIFRLDTWAALLVGVVGGLLTYYVNFYGFTGLFPWFAEARNWISILTHIAFGVSGAWAYKELAKREVLHEVRTA
ncbi:MAG: hypothetical protein AB1409_07560 [Pseudomonadota bacterium]